jgi:hypothetical protein
MAPAKKLHRNSVAVIGQVRHPETEARAKSRFFGASHLPALKDRRSLQLVSGVSLGLAGLAFVFSLGCERRVPDEPPQTTPAVTREPAKSAAAPKPRAPSAPLSPVPDVVTRVPMPERVVAIGDLHGDLAATKRALALGGLMNEAGRWIGGKSVLVQTGDLLDRGDDEQAIVDLFERLEVEAKREGGAVYVLHGNHELMNAALDFRYVTSGGFRDFEDAPDLNLDDRRLSRLPEPHRARAAAFLPGGAYARKLAHHPVVLVVGETVFAHGGVLPSYANDPERLNREVRAWLLGESDAGASVLRADDGPVWSRHFGDQPSADDCALLRETLNRMKSVRMVVGHTVQQRINPACDGRVYRIDVGMAAHYGGRAQVLEITERGPRVLE